MAARRGTTPERQHIIDVLLDEIHTAPRQRMHLPMPRDRRLLKIASQLLADPPTNAAWPNGRTGPVCRRAALTRHFRDETTLSFAQWRQQARLSKALRQLTDGRSVADIAHALGFSSASAFVTVFRRHFGLPPGRYLARAGHGLETGLDPARGFIPAASG
jgi:methylphosphotriester-DNA--protein-cysteine methyltransferase